MEEAKDGENKVEEGYRNCGIRLLPGHIESYVKAGESVGKTDIQADGEERWQKAEVKEEGEKRVK